MPVSEHFEAEFHTSALIPYTDGTGKVEGFPFDLKAELKQPYPATKTILTTPNRCRIFAVVT